MNSVHCHNQQQSWHQQHITTTDDESVLDAAPACSESPLRILEIKELGERIRRVPTEKLPADLREAFAGFTSSFSDAGSFLKEAPSKPEEMIPFLLKTAQDPAFMDKMTKLVTAGGTAAVRLRDVAARYGIENLDLSPGAMGGMILPSLDAPGEGKTPGTSLPQ